MPQADPKALMSMLLELKEELRQLREENQSLLEALWEDEDDRIAYELMDLLNSQSIPKGALVSPLLSVARN